MKILILFPGKTDEKTYQPIVSEIESNEIEYELRLGSAHKSPELVREILKEDFDMVISGAGLSAALPGVIASEKLVPVLGVPCPGAYGGLDSFLSIAQMPPGVPVLCVKKENVAKESLKILKAMKQEENKLNIVGSGKSAEKAMKTLNEMNINFETKTDTQEGINIVFKNIDEPTIENDNLVIYCPEAEDSKPEDAIKSMENAKFGLWVGLNRGENAAIAAVQIMRKTEALATSRKKFEEKCAREDNEVKK